jgi:CRISPR-associated protein Cas1
VQRRIRQFRGLADDALAMALARRVVMAKIEMQLRHVLRASRKADALRDEVVPHVLTMRGGLRRAARAPAREALMGEEGIAARGYFAALSALVLPEAGEEMRPRGRSRRPPEDRFNALLSFGYGLLYRDIVGAILRVGLEASFGVLHQARSSAFPLALDLMELFRVPVVDMAVLGAVNRRTFDLDRDFSVTAKQVWLSEDGRRKLIDAYERRKHEEYRHDVLGFSLSYARMIELEVRLLEKEWSGEPGLFARFRIR